MNITKPEADLAGFITDLRMTLSSQKCLSKGPNLIKITTTATELLTQAAAVPDAHLPEARFQQHVTNLHEALASLNPKSLHTRLHKICKILTIASLIFTIATAIMIAVPLLAVSPWILSAPASFFLLSLLALKMLSRKKRMVDERIQSVASMTKYAMKFAGASTFAGKEISRTVSEVLCQINSDELHRLPKPLEGSIHIPPITIPKMTQTFTQREPSITVTFPDRTLVSYQCLGGHEHQEKQLTEYFVGLEQQLGRLLGDNNPEKLHATFTNLITLHTPNAGAEEFEYLSSALGATVLISAPNAPTSPRNTIIKLDHAQMLSHLHVLYKFRTGENGSSVEAYVIGSLIRTIPLDVLQIPHTRIKKSDLKGVQCTAKYSQIFSTQAAALAHMEQAVKESMSVPG